MMKRKWAVGILFLMLLTSFYGVSVCSASPLRIAYPEFAPFHYTDDDGELTGFFHDIIEEALGKRMGIQLMWTPYPWARCQENVKFGKDDAIMTAPTPGRAEFTRTHQDPFYEKTLHLFTYAAHPQMYKITGVKSLGDILERGYTVITYSGNGWHKKHVESLGIRAYETSSLASVWQMLALKRGDIVIEWPPAATPLLRELELQHLVTDTGIALAAMPFHLLIRTDSAYVDILEEFNVVIQEMRQDGTLSAIVKRYH